MKKKITAAALLILLFAMLALSTVANDTAKGKATNVITTSAISMSVKENHADNAAPATDAGTGSYLLPGTLMPSQSVTQKAAVHNDGSEPFYTRVKVDVAVKDSNGAALDGFDGYVTLGGTHANWIKQGDWYYYNTAVGGGMETEPVFTALGLADAAPNGMMDAGVTVTVTAQAVQSKNNIPAGGNVTNVSGWPGN